MNLTIASQAFAHNGKIPPRYTCDGADRSPPLQWSGLPEGTKSLVLIVDDPDAPDPTAPKITWVHWVLYNLPPTATSLAEGVAANALPAGTRALVAPAGGKDKIDQQHVRFHLASSRRMQDDHAQPKFDVFLSYASEDSEWCEQLAEWAKYFRTIRFPPRTSW